MCHKPPLCKQISDRKANGCSLDDHGGHRRALPPSPNEQRDRFCICGAWPVCYSNATEKQLFLQGSQCYWTGILLQVHHTNLMHSPNPCQLPSRMLSSLLTQNIMTGVDLRLLQELLHIVRKYLLIFIDPLCLIYLLILTDPLCLITHKRTVGR